MTGLTDVIRVPRHYLQLIFAAALLLPGAWAHAQDEADDDGQAASDTVDEIVITGSRIARRDYVSSSPIMTVEEATLQESGQIALNEMLNELPQFRADDEQGQGGGGRALVNLRGLGPSRNLVLLDGRRLPISSEFGEVDTSILPSTIVSSVETITGGASAVYGSDAMSGVVNFISVRDFEGVRLDAHYGNSAKSDFGQSTLSLMMGGDFSGGQGNGLIALSVTDRDYLWGKKRQNFFKYGVPSSYIGQGTARLQGTNAPSQAAVDSLFGSYGYAPGEVPASNAFGFNDDGTLFSQNFGAQNYRFPEYEWFGEYAYAVINGQNVRMPVSVQRHIKSSLEQRNLFAKTEYEFSEAAVGYVQALVTFSGVNTNSGGTLTQFGDPMVPVTNPFIPADLASLLASRPDPNADFVYHRRYVEFGGKNWDEDYYSQQYILGLKGDLNYKDWSYDVYFAYDHVRHAQTQNDAVFLSRVNTLLQAPDGGASICEGGYNPFGRANSLATSQECLDFIGGTTSSSAISDRNTIEASVQGSIIDMPAGPLQFSAVVGYREDSFDYNPDKALAEQDVQAVVASSPVDGKIDVTEIALETAIPVLDSLTVNLAGRYSDYNLSGGVSTYKIDALWRPVDALLFRGGFQRAIRAPNIGELFSPLTGDQVGFGSPPQGGEPCDIRTNARMNGGAQLRQLCIDTGVPAATIDTYIFPTTAAIGAYSGNISLDPEEADTVTFGVVWTPDLNNGNLSLSVDYFDIEIVDVIGQLDGSVSLARCYNQDGVSNPNYSASNEYCQFIDRNTQTGEFELIRQPYFNLGRLQTSGIDLTVNYAFDLNSGGTLFLNSLVSFVDAFEVVTLEGDPAIDYKGTIGGPGGPKPDWQSLTTVGYSQGPFSASLRWFYLPSMEDDSTAINPNSTQRGVESYQKFNLVGTWDLSDSFDLRWGITNILDEDIPQVGNSRGNTDYATYDLVGRSYYVGLRMEF